jgi:hypothetical protein
VITVELKKKKAVILEIAENRIVARGGCLQLFDSTPLTVYAALRALAAKQKPTARKIDSLIDLRRTQTKKIATNDTKQRRVLMGAPSKTLPLSIDSDKLKW